MQDRPDPQALLGAVRDFLQNDALPQLEGRAKLHARVAANVVALVQRQLEFAPRSDAAELARLRRRAQCRAGSPHPPGRARSR
jgi:hypothetical protein